jgi:hypothetical protein
VGGLPKQEGGGAGAVSRVVQSWWVEWLSAGAMRRRAAGGVVL